MQEHQIRQRPAFAFAMRHHDAVGQQLPYVGGSYIQHPLDVALVVSYAEHSDWMIDAALLHDTVDDTGATLIEIEREFGREAAQCVEILSTGRPGSSGKSAPRAERKAQERARMVGVAPEIKTVRLADVIVNCRTIVRRDPRFARVYLPEKQSLIEALLGGDALLLDSAARIVAAGMKDLESVMAGDLGKASEGSGTGQLTAGRGLAHLEEIDLMSLVEIHTRLSPEALSGDGEIPGYAVARERDCLTRALKLKGLEIGLTLEQLDECAVCDEYDRRAAAMHIAAGHRTGERA